MLKSFYVKNYKSWKEGTFIDMSAESISEHLSNVIYYNKEKGKLLKNFVIYGSNASGKSNLLDAITYMVSKILEIKAQDELGNAYIDTFGEKGNGLNAFLKMGETKCKTYANKVGVSTFEITFIAEGDEYSYGFEVKQDTIIDEWFTKRNTVIFERKRKKLDKIKAYSAVTSIVPSNRLYFAYIFHFAQIKKEDPLLHLKKFINSIGILKDFEKLNSLFLNDTLKNMFLMDKNNLSKLNRMFTIIDFGIVKMEYEESNKRIYFIHNGKNEAFKVYLEDESLGTKKILFSLLGLFKRFEYGGVIIADEFTASLHPLLSKLILDMISDDEINIGNCQIVFSTHDVFFMRKEQFRRDEINFVYKDKSGQSHINRLYDFKDNDKRVRNDATYWKNYLKGMYEGTPNINYDLFLSDKKEIYGKVSKKQKK